MFKVRPARRRLGCRVGGPAGPGSPGPARNKWSRRGRCSRHSGLASRHHQYPGPGGPARLRFRAVGLADRHRVDGMPLGHGARRLGVQRLGVPTTRHQGGSAPAPRSGGRAAWRPWGLSSKGSPTGCWGCWAACVLRCITWQYTSSAFARPVAGVPPAGSAAQPSSPPPGLAGSSSAKKGSNPTFPRYPEFQPRNESARLKNRPSSPSWPCSCCATDCTSAGPALAAHQRGRRRGGRAQPDDGLWPRGGARRHGRPNHPSALHRPEPAKPCCSSLA